MDFGMGKETRYEDMTEHGGNRMTFRLKNIADAFWHVVIEKEVQGLFGRQSNGQFPHDDLRNKTGIRKPGRALRRGSTGIECPQFHRFAEN
jgi:hypothetical protein